MLNFDILEKVLEMVSPLNFVYDFSSKIFMLYFMTDRILLPDCLYFLRDWSICVL